MTDYLTSGSAFERMGLCPSSVALPHSNHETVYSSRGTAIHEFLENVSRIGRADALQLVDAEWRGACEQLNLDGLDGQLALAAEVALAYNFDTDTARELGRGVGRLYGDVGENELPATLDVIGVRGVAAGNRGLVIDWKTGWMTRRRIETVQQLDVGALLAARAYDLQIVEVQLVHVFEDIEPWVQRRIVEAWEVDAFALYARDTYLRALEIRHAMRAGVMPEEFYTGPWCDQCPAREWCPAQTRMLRAVLSRDLFDGEMRMQQLGDDSLAQLWHQLHEAQSVLRFLKGKVLGVAATRTISLGKNPENQKDRWLGKVTAEGNEKLDGEKVFDTVAEVLADDTVLKLLGVKEPLDVDAIASKATRVVSSKKDLKAALKDAVPRGKAAAAERVVLERLRKNGGAKRDWKTDVKEYETSVALAEPTDGRLALPPPADDDVSREFWDSYNTDEETPHDGDQGATVDGAAADAAPPEPEGA